MIQSPESELVWEELEEEVAKAERRAAGKSTEGLPTTTTCNGLAVQLGQHIKAPLALGQFDIDKKLKAAGFAEAWIPAKSGKRPGYGDVFQDKYKGRIAIYDYYLP